MRMVLRSGSHEKGLNQVRTETTISVRYVTTSSEVFAVVEGRVSFATVSRCVASSRQAIVEGDPVVSLLTGKTTAAGPVALAAADLTSLLLEGREDPLEKDENFVGSISEASAQEDVVAGTPIMMGKMILAGLHPLGNGEARESRETETGVVLEVGPNAMTHGGNRLEGHEDVITDHEATLTICGGLLDVRSATTTNAEGVLGEGIANTVMTSHVASFAVSSNVVPVAEGNLVNTNIHVRRCAMISLVVTALEATIANTLTTLKKRLPAGRRPLKTSGQHARCVRTTREATALAEMLANTRMM